MTEQVTLDCAVVTATITDNGEMYVEVTDGKTHFCVKGKKIKGEIPWLNRYVYTDVSKER